MSTAIITRRIEIDAGHRVPAHDSKCRHLHGHRYVFILAAIGPINEPTGGADDGMVTDFGVLKTFLVAQVDELWDHRFLLWEYDPLWRANIYLVSPAERTFASYGAVGVPFVPTAENLAKDVYERACLYFEAIGSPVVPAWVECRETPNCVARYPWVTP